MWSLNMQRTQEWVNQQSQFWVSAKGGRKGDILKFSVEVMSNFQKDELFGNNWLIKKQGVEGKHSL